MLDLVPLAGRWGEMTNADFQAEFAAQLCQTPFPEVATSAIAAAAISRDEEPRGLRVLRAAHFAPPATDTLHGKFGGVMIAADTHPTLVAPKVVNAIRDGFTQLLIDEIIDFDFFGLPFGTPFPATIFVSSHELLFLRVDADDRLLAALECCHLLIAVPELGLPIFVAF